MVDRRIILDKLLADLSEEKFKTLSEQLQIPALCDTYSQLKTRIEILNIPLKHQYPESAFEPENINETRKHLLSDVKRELKKMEQSKASKPAKPAEPAKKAKQKNKKVNPLRELGKLVRANNAQTSVLMKAPLRLGIRNMAQSFRDDPRNEHPFKFQANAMEILHQVVESHLTTFLSNTHMCTDFASRSTTFPKDIELTKQLMQHNKKVAYNIRMEREKEREKVVRR